MKQFLILLLLFLVSTISAANAQRVIKFDALNDLLNKQDDTIRVVNFWATWCEPCVKEFPEFQRVGQEFRTQKVKVIFVSLDFKKDLKRSLAPFLKSHHVTDESFLLDETDYNSWIDRIDSTWEGNLPATLVIANGAAKRKFYPKEFTYVELKSLIEKTIDGNLQDLKSSSHSSN